MGINLLDIFRTPFPKNTSEGKLLNERMLLNYLLTSFKPNFNPRAFYFSAPNLSKKNFYDVFHY